VRRVRTGILAPALTLAPLLAFAALICGCNKKIHLPIVMNQRPEVSLTQAPVATTKPYFYSYELRWSGFDPDGRVDHYLIAQDPPGPPAIDTVWTQTTDNRRTFTFRSDDPETLGTAANPGGHHTIVIKAVDNQGLASAPAARSFFSYTVAPEVHLSQPAPNALFHPALPPTVTFRWSGIDPDGVKSRKPVKYKFHLFRDGTDGFSVRNIGAFAESLRFVYPPGFSSWDSTVSDTSVQIRGLTPQATYVFAVTCFDEAGAYDPVWSFNKNLLWFTIDYPFVIGPKITMFNEFFNYTYLSPGYLNDPRAYVFLEVPVSRPLTIHWSADPGQFASMKSYRWAMDIERLDDETTRTGPGDVRHWSFPALGTTQATVGPFASTDSTHLFFIEAEDNNGLKSLGILSLLVVKPDFRNELLFVDDTRFRIDEVVAGTDSVNSPPGNWPSAAEVDTFLFARGGVRWRYYPAGALSPPGIFHGYHYDTLSTALLPTPIVALATLARYRHVVWYGDQAGDVGITIPALRYMCRSGQQNTLATYANMGGQVWLMGGGEAYNSLIGSNVRTNDFGSTTLFSAAAGELAPGRMMFDQALWQSEISSSITGSAAKSPRATGGWPGAPDYSALPVALTRKTQATDPIWPLRTSTKFYLTQTQGEFLSKPNSVLEDADPDVDVFRMVPALDTLYTNTAGQPLMTLSHASGSAPFVFSGFPIWFFQRGQAIQLGDWVLQSLWHLPRDPVWRGPGTAAAPADRP
jgi:hypothetical protein